MTFYDHLIGMIREIKEDQLKIDFRRRSVVARNLVYIYHASMAAEQLLSEAAIASFKPGPFNARLLEYYKVHLEEEKGELPILQSDLAALGLDPGMPDGLVMAMVGTQYYMFKHLHPVTLLGYLAVVEIDPMPETAVNLLEELHGKNGQDGFKFMRMHAVKDPQHAAEIKALIEEAPQALHNLIEFSAGNTLWYCAQAAQRWNM